MIFTLNSAASSLILEEMQLKLEVILLFSLRGDDEVVVTVLFMIQVHSQPIISCSSSLDPASQTQNIFHITFKHMSWIWI